MNTDLHRDIQQKRFRSIEEHLVINAMYTGLHLRDLFNEQLKTSGLNVVTYNILRILAGAGEASTIKAIQEKVLDKKVNLSRSVDRLVQLKLVKRKTCSEDRREIRVSIAEQGQKLLDELADPMNLDDLISPLLSQQDMESANRSLDRLRSIVPN